MSAGEQEEPQWKTWTDVPELKGTRFGQLLQDLRDLEAEYEPRIAAVRQEIAALIQTLSFPIRVLDRQARWVPAQRTTTINRARLAKLLTPPQLQSVLDEGEKKAHLEIRPVKAADPLKTPEMTTGSPTTSPPPAGA